MVRRSSSRSTAAAAGRRLSAAGLPSEAEDALQEAWLRTTRADPAAVANPGAWLTTLVGRVCIEILRARQARHEQLSATWEPVVSEHGDPEEASLHADAVGIALLVVLDSLEPAERLAVVLHDMFGVPFEQVAAVVGRTPAATRQLASRARRRLREHAPQPRAASPPSDMSSTRFWPPPAPATSTHC